MKRAASRAALSFSTVSTLAKQREERVTIHIERHEPTQADFKPPAKSAAPHVSVALGAEESDTYPRLVARLNPKWRVICCRDAIQWILQSRCGQRDGLPRWRSRYFFRTRQGLVSGSREYAGEISGHALVVLLRLPDRFPENGGAA
jgi:hypothetical protein